MTANDDIELVEVFQAKNAVDAELFKQALEDAGLKVRVDGDMLQGAAGDLMMTPPRIIVPSDEAEQARQLIEELEAKMVAHDQLESTTADEDPDEEEDTTSECLSCGAIMTPEADRCTKCGWSFKEGQTAVTV